MKFEVWLRPALLAGLWVSIAAAGEPIARDYGEIRNVMRELLARYPQRVRAFELGLSDANVMIEGLAFGDGPVRNLVVAAHHGNEYGSVEIARALMRDLAAAPIPGQTVYVVPVLNTSGYDRRRRTETVGGFPHDPNRDYPGPCGTSGPFRLKSTRALSAFVEREGIVASAALHTHSPAVLYPWGISTRDTRTENEAVFIDLARAATVESGYPVGNSTELLYPADGTFEDWAYWRHGVWSLLFEAGSTHTPTQDQVDELVRVNVPGLRRMLAQAPRQRAERHAFTGKCDRRLRFLDLRDE
jgi:carboxypeptidase T